MSLLTCRRRGVGKSLPYDAEIEYLQSTGTQYIDIPYQFNPDKDELYATFSLKLGQRDEKYMISAYPWNTNNNRFGLGVYTYFTMGIGRSGTGATRLQPNTANDGKVHTWHYKNGKIEIPELSISLDNLTGAVSNNIRLFWGYDNATKGDIVAYKHLRDDELLIDLISVRVGQTGYLYDKVGGQLFGNSGTGNFILGADK